MFINIHIYVEKHNEMGIILSVKNLNVIRNNSKDLPNITSKSIYVVDDVSWY